jgi:tetratricopeptide (TPR) repeat protein
MVDLQSAFLDALDGQYDIEREIGRGGMSIVFQARDLKHNRDVAIKVLRPELSAQIGADRFLQEVEFAANLSNPHILPLFDSGEVDGILYYVMPLVGEESLRERLEREGTLPIDEAVDIARDVAAALESAHEHGIVHRDIKPGNILFLGGEAVVSDFGIARAVTVEGGERLTQSGLSIGSPAYMSPEQAAGDREVDGRSDLYSLGCVLFEMLTGQPPYVRETAQATIAAHLAEEPPSAREMRAEVPKGVDEIILTALQKDRSLRFASTSELVTALEHPELMPERAKERRRRRRIRTATTALAVIAALLGVGFLAWRAFGPEPLVASDPNRVVVFPIVDMTREQQLVDQGPGLAAGIGYALEETEPLKWLDGWDWLAPEERSDLNRLTPERMKQIAREQGARYYVQGTIVNQGDSLAVVLRLFDSMGRGGQLARSGRSIAPDDEILSRATIQAVGGLLPTIVGESVDVSALSNRDIRALANWTMGLSDFRNARFESAYDHFRLAIEQDSLLALAAVNGALAAMWVSKIPEAQQMAEAAVAHDSLLTQKHRHYAHAIRHYTRGEADPAVERIRSALRADTLWSEAWFALGEIFDQLIPSPGVVNELAALLGTRASHPAIAEISYRTSLEHDPKHSPTLARLADLALYRNDLAEAGVLLDRFFAVDPDSLFVLHHTLVLRCAAGEMNQENWSRIAAETPLEALRAAVALSTRAWHPECAETGYLAVLNSETAVESHLWGALVGLQSLYVAQRRTDRLNALTDSDQATALGAVFLYPLYTAAGADVRQGALDLAASLGVDYSAMGFAYLWVAGEAAALENDTAALAGITSALAENALASGSGLDALFAEAFTAHEAIARRDTASALEHFLALEPSGDRRNLRWDPWTSLGPEWLRLAEILHAVGRHEEAIGVATRLEHPHPVVYLAFLPSSLDLRARAYEALGDFDSAVALRERADALVGTETIVRP